MNHIDIINEKIFSGYGKFSATLKRWKKSGDKVVFTNGCFDLVHRGHIDYLAKTADLGDRLVIGLNGDKSVAGLKGTGRPLIDEDSRAFLLASLFFVDAVVLFSEDTPEILIGKILPDYLVKGSDYTVPEIAGHEAVLANGGKVETIPLLPGFSSSGIINKIRNNLP
jgi:D-glycero-beta-D-manno-heptose 1-phosphate adenylyltransferase